MSTSTKLEWPPAPPNPTIKFQPQLKYILNHWTTQTPYTITDQRKRHWVGESKKRRDRGRDQGGYLDGNWWRWMVRKETTTTTTDLSFTTHTRGRCRVAHHFLWSMLPTKHRSLHDQTQKKDKQIWSLLVSALSEPGKIRYPTIGSFTRFDVIRILLLSILAENRVPPGEEAIQGL